MVEELVKMKVNNDMTADFLRQAYGGESMAHMRYLIWAEIAEQERMPNIARLLGVLLMQNGLMQITISTYWASGKAFIRLQREAYSA